MNFRKILRTLLLTALALVVIAGTVFGGLWWYFHPGHGRVDGTVYGERHGMELTFDVLTPESPNGLGIVLIVSGGWKSDKDGFRVELAAPLLRRGYTVFSVYHVSQPKATENLGDGGPPKSFVKAFGPRSREMAVWKEIGRDVSPIDHIVVDLPPVLILHGDRDTLVPLDQSTRFQARAVEAGGRVELVIRRGKSHAWLGMLWDIRRFAQWFDAHLRAEG